MSYCYGAHLRKRLRTACAITVIVSRMIEVACTVAAVAFAQPVAAVFTEDAQVMGIVTAAMPAFMAGMLVFGAQLGMQSIFMSTGRGLRALIVAFVRKIVLFIPLAFVLPQSFGAWGVIYAQPVSDVCSVVFCSVLMACSLPGILRFGEPAGRGK